MSNVDNKPAIETRHMTVKVENGHHERTQDGQGWRWIVDNSTEHVIAITIYWEEIANLLGKKACRNKSFEAKEIGGFVTARKVT